MQHPERARQARGLERFLMITDGVVAIAITLLVLPLIEAVSAGDPEHDTARRILSDLGWEFFSFFLSFVVIAMVWQNHRDIFGSAEVANPWLIWTGVGWMLAVILIPVSTALIVEHGDEQHTLLVYIANLTACITCTTVATLILHRCPDLTEEGTPIPWDEVRQGIVAFALVLLTFVIALFLPVVGYWVLLLLTFAGPISNLIRRSQFDLT